MLNSILPISTISPSQANKTQRKQQQPIRFGGNEADENKTISLNLQRDNSDKFEYLLVNRQNLLKVTEGKKVDLKNLHFVPVKNLPKSTADDLADHSEGNKDWKTSQKTWGALHGIKDRIFNWDNIKTDVGIACLITVATCWLPGSQLIFIPTYLAISNSMHAVRGAYDGWKNPGKYLKNEKPGKLDSQNNESGLATALTSSGTSATPEQQEAPATKDNQSQQQGDGQKKDGSTSANA